MYTVWNFKTKKELKIAVDRRNALIAEDANDPLALDELHAEYKRLTRWLRVTQPGPFGGNEPTVGEVSVEGPHPQPHKWYARAALEPTVMNQDYVDAGHEPDIKGVIVQVKS